MSMVITGRPALVLSGALAEGHAANVFLPGWNNQALAVRTITQHRLYYLAVVHAFARTWNEVVVEVEVVGSASSVIRIGLYTARAKSGGELGPDALVSDFGTVAADTMGEKTLTIDQRFAAGFEFLCFSTDGTGLSLQGPDATWGIKAPVSGGSGSVALYRSAIPTVLRADGGAALPAVALAPTDMTNSTNCCLGLQDV